MFFANPILLWSLLGVLLPIGIHLWSRHEARTIKVGSIELLEASDTVRSRAISPNEWWLLILRVLIVSILAFLLSGPRIAHRGQKEGLVYVIEASLLREGLPAELTTAPGESPQIRLLEKGLPVWDPDDTPGRAAEPPGYWQLVPELNALNADSILVFTRGYMSGTRSKRPESAGHIRYIVLEDSEPAESPLLARGDFESAELYTTRTRAGITTFDRRPITASGGDYSVMENGDSIRFKSESGDYQLPLYKRRALWVGLHTGDGMQASSSYMEAALKAVANYLEQEVRIEEIPTASDSIPAGADLIMWLSEEPPPETDGTVLYYQPDSLATELIQPDQRMGYYRLTERLNLSNSVSGHLPERLLQLMLPPAQWDAPIRKADRRQWEAGMLSVSTVAGTEKSGGDGMMRRPGQDSLSESRDISNYFWLVLLFLLTSERLLALWRKQ